MNEADIRATMNVKTLMLPDDALLLSLAFEHFPTCIVSSCRKNESFSIHIVRRDPTVNLACVLIFNGPISNFSLLPSHATTGDSIGDRVTQMRKMK